MSVLVASCDYGAANQAINSTGVIVELESIETTVSGQFEDAATGKLLDVPVNLRFEGPDGNAVVDMYTDPIATQQVVGALTSFGIHNSRDPSSQNPLRLRVVATAQGYQKTSRQIEIHAAGTKNFTMSMLSTNPNRQPEGASGVRDKSGETSNDGAVQADLNVQTPNDNAEGRANLYLPEKSILRSEQSNVDGQLTVDLSHYSPTEKTLEALPGNGTVQTDTETERFAVAGYMNLQIRDTNGSKVSRIEGGKSGGEIPKSQVRFPDDAVHPTTGSSLKEGQELELFRYDTNSGTWSPDTTLTVEALPPNADKAGSGRGPNPPGKLASASGDLGVQWSPQDLNDNGWWAWGTRSKASSDLEAEVQVSSSEQEGNVGIVLKRPGLEYTNSHALDELEGGTHSLTTLVGQSSIPHYKDYALTLTTRDGQSQTIENVDPSGGSYTIKPPAPTSTPRVDVLFKAYPECPSDQKVRITSVPTVTIYYRESEAQSGAPWHTASADKITWVMDDPDNPTYIKWAELRLDGLEEDTRYDMYTTYDGKRYEASGRVTNKEEATIEDGRVLVEYGQDFSKVCS